MPKEEMVNRFEEKFEQVKLRAILTASALNRARTKEEKNVLYKEVKSLFFIIQTFNNLEKMIEYLHKKGGRTIKVLTWEVGKGLDDFLLSKESLNQKITAHLFYS